LSNNINYEEFSGALKIFQRLKIIISLEISKVSGIFRRFKNFQEFLGIFKKFQNILKILEKNLLIFIKNLKN
jgi:hypothetical protein